MAERKRPEWIGRALLEEPDKEVFAVEEAGTRYWIKKGRKTGSTAIHSLGYRLTGLPFLHPVERKDPLQSARFEAKKLRRLKAKGVPVPAVVWEGEGLFVMEDRGESLAPRLKRERRKEAEPRLHRVAESLAQLHRAGEYHGASQIRNFTLSKEGEVSLIDFEESFSEETPLEALQFRDLFLLLYSLHRQRQEADYPILLQRYMERSGNENFAEELQRLYGRFRWLAAIVGIEGVRRRLGSDAEILHRLFESLKG